MKKAPFLRSYTLFYLLFLYSPIILLPIFAFNDSKVVAFPLSGFIAGLVPRDAVGPEPADRREKQPDHRAVGGLAVDRAGVSRPAPRFATASRARRRSWG